jgi:ribosomal protein S19E (S16A)
MATDQIHELVQAIRTRLTTLGRVRGIELGVAEDATPSEDDWLYVEIASPSRSVRVFEYAELVLDVEKALREEGIGNVLLVPTRP